MVQLFTQTDKQLIPTLPRYAFAGRIVVVQSVHEAERAVQFLRTCPILGIDTETRPSFRRGTVHKVALLQIAGGGICFLFRLNYMGFPDCLAQLLENPDIPKIGLSLKDDVHQLRQRRPDFTPKGFIDLQQTAAEMGIRDMSLAKLFANFFRQRISKTAQLTNWEADALDEKQRVYAATDADACILLYQRMRELQASGDFELLPMPEPPVPLVPCTTSPCSTTKAVAPKRQTRKPSATLTTKRKTTTATKPATKAKAKASSKAITKATTKPTTPKPKTVRKTPVRRTKKTEDA